MSSDIDLRCCDVAEMIADLPDGCASAIHSDAPWRYGMGLPANYGDDTGLSLKGLARMQYDGLPELTIAEHLASTYRIAARNAYLFFWCTFPKLAEWMAVTPGRWKYVTGAAWGKSRGLGVGKHFRGDTEILLVYKKGTPMPIGGSHTNLWLTCETQGGLWLAPRQEHSEKPQVALRALIEMAVPADGLLVDLYAGASASMARACRALGRRYVGAELDEARWQRAMIRLSQQEMFCEAPA
jgi:N6-adenosine-specific RNA methylase IME4